MNEASTQTDETPKNQTNQSRPQELSVKASNRKYVNFTLRTDAFLVHGVQKYGVGRWKEMIEFYNFPAYRTPVHLKDRWRTLRTNGMVTWKLNKYHIVDEELKEKFNLIDTTKENFNLGEADEDFECSTNDVDDKEGDEKLKKLKEIFGKSGSNDDSNDFEDNVFLSDSSGNNQSGSSKKSLNRSSRIVSSSEDTLSQQTNASDSETSADHSVSSSEANIPAKVPKKASKRKRSMNESVSEQNERVASKTPRKMWEKWEVENLKKGVSEYGVGNWQKILNNFHFNNRTKANLKDKFRNMQKDFKS